MSIFIGNKNNKKIFSINKQDQHDVPDENTIFHSQLPYLEVEVFDVPAEPEENNLLTEGIFSRVIPYDFSKLNLVGLENKAYLIVVDGRIVQPYYSAQVSWEKDNYKNRNMYYVSAYNPLGTMSLGLGEKDAFDPIPSLISMSQAGSGIPNYTQSKFYLPVGDPIALVYPVRTHKVQLVVLKNTGWAPDTGYTYSPANKNQDAAILIDNKVLTVEGEDIISNKYLSVDIAQSDVGTANIGQEISVSSSTKPVLHSTLLGTHYFENQLSVAAKRWAWHTWGGQPTTLQNISLTTRQFGIPFWMYLDSDGKPAYERIHPTLPSNPDYTDPVITSDDIGSSIFHIVQGSKAKSQTGSSSLVFETEHERISVDNTPIFAPESKLLRQVGTPIRLPIASTTVSQDYVIPPEPGTRYVDYSGGQSIVTLKTITIPKNKSINGIPLLYSITIPDGTVPDLKHEEATVQYSRLFAHTNENGVHSGLMNLPINNRSIFYTTTICRDYIVGANTGQRRLANFSACMFFTRREKDQFTDELLIQYQTFLDFFGTVSEHPDGYFRGSISISLPELILDVVPLL